MSPDINSLPHSGSAISNPSSPLAHSSSNAAASSSSSSSSNTAAPAISGTMSISQEALPPALSSPRPSVGTTSLQATATVNAGLAQEDLRRSPTVSPHTQLPPHTGRRRSNVLLNLQLNNPAVPAPGEMVNEPHAPRSLDGGSPRMGSIGSGVGDPHHLRNPSLGEIHQELEQEQEAQVNRLLQMIRVQQQQLQTLQAAHGLSPSPSAIDDSSPLPATESQAPPFPPVTQLSGSSNPIPISRSPSDAATAQHPRSSFDLARADLRRRSRTPSRHASPRLGATPLGAEGESWSLGRDESAFYQAETQMLVRENQMLRLRIRELERQVRDMHGNSAISREPSLPSNLLVERSEMDVTPRPGGAGDGKSE